MNSRWTTHRQLIRPFSRNDICQAELRQRFCCVDRSSAVLTQSLQVLLHLHIAGFRSGEQKTHRRWRCRFDERQGVSTCRSIARVAIKARLPDGRNTDGGSTHQGDSSRRGRQCLAGGRTTRFWFKSHRQADGISRRSLHQGQISGDTRRKNAAISVALATTERAPPRVVRCSMATVGGIPAIRAASGRPSCVMYWRA